MKHEITYLSTGFDKIVQVLTMHTILTTYCNRGKINHVFVPNINGRYTFEVEVILNCFINSPKSQTKTKECENHPCYPWYLTICVSDLRYSWDRSKIVTPFQGIGYSCSQTNFFFFILHVYLKIQYVFSSCIWGFGCKRVFLSFSYSIVI